MFNALQTSDTWKPCNVMEVGKHADSHTNINTMMDVSSKLDLSYVLVRISVLRMASV